MPKDPGKGPSRKKVKMYKTTTRQRYTCEQKNLARDLKKEGKQPHEIIKIFKDKYDVVVKASTLATWYNPKNMETHEQRVSRNTSMAHVETHVNPTQRPTIMIDMEFALVGMIKKANNIGTATTRKSLRKMGKAIFDKLRASNIYDGPGERRRSLSVLNEVQMNKLLEDISEDRILCPLCKAPVTSVSDDSLNVHLQIHHNPGDEQIPSPPGGKKFTFQGSDGWVRNLLHRLHMHNVLTVGEMGSNNNQEASSPIMKEYPEKKEHHNEDRNPVFNQLETHKEHRNECSTEIEQFETDSSFDNENSVDTHKGSDVELDLFKDYKIKECSVRPEWLGVLDIDCTRNYVNTLPCTPGGDCSCDTDFTSQIPEYINDYFNMSPDNTIFIVDDDIILKFIVSEDFQA